MLSPASRVRFLSIKSNTWIDYRITWDAEKVVSVQSSNLAFAPNSLTFVKCAERRIHVAKESRSDTMNCASAMFFGMIANVPGISTEVVFEIPAFKMVNKINRVYLLLKTWFLTFSCIPAGVEGGDWNGTLCLKVSGHAQLDLCIS